MNTDILIINGSPRKNKNCFKISEEISNKLNQNNISNKIYCERNFIFDLIYFIKSTPPVIILYNIQTDLACRRRIFSVNLR